MMSTWHANSTTDHRSKIRCSHQPLSRNSTLLAVTTKEGQSLMIHSRTKWQQGLFVVSQTLISALFKISRISTILLVTWQWSQTSWQDTRVISWPSMYWMHAKPCKIRNQQTAVLPIWCHWRTMSNLLLSPSIELLTTTSRPSSLKLETILKLIVCWIRRLFRTCRTRGLRSLQVDWQARLLTQQYRATSMGSSTN